MPFRLDTMLSDTENRNNKYLRLGIAKNYCKGQLILKKIYFLKSGENEADNKKVCTICPRNLVYSYVVSIIEKLEKTFWTCSTYILGCRISSLYENSRSQILILL